MKVLVIIVSYNFERWMDRCIGSLRCSEYPVDTVVIDNGSQDATVSLLKERYPEVHVVCNRENLGFGKANNIGMRLALEKGYDAVFLLNQDAWIDPNTIGTLVALCRKHPSFGILSPVHLTGKGDAIDVGFADYTGIHTTEELPHSEITEVPFVNAAFWMIPTSVLRTVGGFSPLFYHYGEDVDFVHRLHYHGLKVGYAPVFGNHDRELRIVTKPMEYRAKCVYLLTAYANINHSFGYAFTKAIGGGCEQVVKSLKRGLWKDAAVYLQRTCSLLLKSGKIYRLRTLYRKPGSHFITGQCPLTTVLWAFILLFLAACQGHQSSFPPGLAEAERLADAYPDSALSVLRAMDMERADVSEETRMLHRLLTVKAEDKLYVLHTSDSLMLPIVRFYEKKGDKKRLAEAYFYLGSTYRDMNNAPRALKVFHQAAGLCEKTGQYTLQGMACGQMGNLFAYQEVYDESLNMHRKARHYYELSGDSLHCAGSLWNWARAYSGKQEKDSALYYYKEAIEMYGRLGYAKKANAVSAELGCFYFDIGEKALSKRMLLRAMEQNRQANNVLLKLGRIYVDEKQPDSARYYFREVVKHGDFRKQCSAYGSLSELEDEQGNHSLAAEYREQHRWRQDSIQAMTQSHTMEKLHLLYRFQHEEQKSHDLALKSQAYLQYIWGLLFCVAILIIIGILVYQNIRRRKREAKEQQERYRQVQEEKYKQSLAYIEANKQELQKLEEKLREADANNDTLQRQLLLAQKEMLELSNRQNQAFRDNRELLEEAFHKSDIYLFFHKACKEDASLKVTDAHWDELRQTLDTTYSHFTDRLYELYPKLSQQELRICYLVKTGIPVKGISLLLSRTKTAITMARCRLYKKIHGTEGNAEMMDAFISEF